MNKHYKRLPAEKVSPMHPDKIADRIAALIIDIGYGVVGREDAKDLKCAVEVLIGHGKCNILIESNIDFNKEEIQKQIKQSITKIAGTTEEKLNIEIQLVRQDKKLAKNQKGKVRAGDNGIFMGHYLDSKSNKLIADMLAEHLYRYFPFDAKIVVSDEEIIISQSNVKKEDYGFLTSVISPLSYGKKIIINQIGEWTGGIDVDTGLTGRKLASDFYGIEAPLGGGNMHGKDLSKADTTLNLICHKLAQENKTDIFAHCAIGDEKINFFKIDEEGNKTIVSTMDYEKCFDTAYEIVINDYGSFESLASWGLMHVYEK